MTDSHTTTPNEPQVAQIDIGELLSSKRHQLRKTLDDVSNSLKLSVDVLEKLESSRFDDIGTPVYVRGYLGLYAKHLELEAAYILDQYNQQNPSEDVAIRPSAGHNLGNPQQQRKRHSKTLSFLVVGLVVAGLIYGYSQMESVVLEKTGQTDDSVVELDVIDNTTTAGNDSGYNSVDTGVNAVLDEANEAQNLANDVLNGESISANNTSLVTNIDLGSALPSNTVTPEVAQPTDSANTATNAANTTVANTTITAANTTNTTATAVSTVAEIVGQNSIDSAGSTDSETAVQATDNQLAENKPTEARLRMAFSDECWIKVTDASGKTLIGRVYKKGQKLNVNVKLPMTLVVGNARFVTSASMDNKAIKLADYKISRQRYRFE